MTSLPVKMLDIEGILRKYELNVSETSLICGDGNFGFSRSLMHLGFQKIIATEIHSEYNPRKEYLERFQENIDSLRNNGHNIFFNIDATNQEHLHKLVEEFKVDVIWWNNPHVTREVSECSVPMFQQMQIENQNLMFDFFRAVPKDVKIKMILTRKQYADWVVSAALKNKWEIFREGKVHYEPLAEYMVEMRPRKTREKFLKRHLTLHGKKIRLSKFPYYSPTKTDLSSLEAKKMYLIEFVSIQKPVLP